MNLWIDDLREPPPGWVWAKSSTEAIDLLASSTYDEVSFDHDLGGDDTTRAVVLWLCETGEWPGVVRIHTANPVGREWLEGMLSGTGQASPSSPSTPAGT